MTPARAEWQGWGVGPENERGRVSPPPGRTFEPGQRVRFLIRNDFYEANIVGLERERNIHRHGVRRDWLTTTPERGHR